LWKVPSAHLIFFDADHRYHAVQSDFLAWIDHCSLGAMVAFHDFDVPDYPGVGSFVNRLLITRIICHGGLVDSIKYGEVATTDVAVVKRRLGYCPYIVAWLLNLIQRFSRPIMRTPTKLFHMKTWTRILGKCLRWGT